VESGTFAPLRTLLLLLFIAINFLFWLEMFFSLLYRILGLSICPTYYQSLKLVVNYSWIWYQSSTQSMYPEQLFIVIILTLVIMLHNIKSYLRYISQVMHIIHKHLWHTVEHHWLIPWKEGTWCLNSLMNEDQIISSILGSTSPSSTCSVIAKQQNLPEQLVAA